MTDNLEGVAALDGGQHEPILTVPEIRQQASRYLTARFGEEYVYRAPETFTNVLERWIWALAAGSPEMAEECISRIEQGLAEAADR
jgi:hypothetical protein